MAWEYRIHRFPKRGSVQRDQERSQQVLNDYGQRGWELVSISDSEALAVFKRRYTGAETGPEEIKASLAAELRELTTAIEELNR